MKKYLSRRKILALITMFLIVLSTNLFRTSAAGSVSGGANGATVGATATVAGLPVNVTLASAAPVTLPSTGGNVTDQIASVGVELPGVATVLSTGVITNSTSGTINASTAHATSTSTVNGINILNGFITAGTIVSKATSDGNGTSATSTGAGSMINNLRINGVLQETANVAPNTVISATGHITVVVGIVPVNVPLNATITLNAQTQSGNGTTTSGIDVAQVVVNVTGNVAGLVSLNVNVAIALASSGVNFTAAPNTCPTVNVSGGTSRSVQVGQTLTFNVSATDPDGDTSTLSASNLPANSSFTPNPATGTPTATGTFSFTPSAAQANQTFNVQFTGSDNRGCGGSSPVPVTVQIQVTPAPPGNNCPVVNVTGGTSRTVQAGQTLSFNVSATDPDGDTATLQATNLPANSSFTPNPATGTPTATGTFSFTPAAGQANQTFNVQFTGTDTHGCSGAGASPVTVQITVTAGPPPNTCPAVNVTGGTTRSIQAGQTLTFDVSATDADGDAVTLTASNLPANSSFNPNPATGTPTATGTFSFTPAAGQANQTFNIQFTGSDTRGCSGAGATPITVQITVTPGPPPNTCPVVNVTGGTTRSVQAGQTLSFNVSATDADGDAVTLTASNLPANATFTPNPATGTPTATGAFSFTPVAGQANQTFNVQFTGTDARGCSGAGATPVTVQITVTSGPPPNTCPAVNVTGGTSRTIQAGQTLGFNVSATDADGDAVTLTASNLPANATFTPNPATGTPTATGAFSFTPAAGQANQTFNVQFTATDTRGCSGAGATPVTVQITVTPAPPANNCPVVNVPFSSQTIQAGQTLTFNVSATDADGDAVTLTASNLPANASFNPNPATGTPTATGTFSFTPAAGQANQTFNVQFTGTDARGCSGAGATPVTVQITVTAGPPPNNCPNLNAPTTTQTIQVGQTLTFNASATDPDGDTVTLTASNLPANSSFTPNPATGTPTALGVFNFTPAAGQANQTFNVTFTATDNRGCSSAGAGNSRTVQINVTPAPVNRCPVISVPGISQTVQAGQTLTFNVSATDPDGDSVTLQASNLPANASFNPNPASGTPTASGTFTFTPTAAQANQTFGVQFTGSDNRGCSGAGATPVTVQITVTPGPPPNRCPTVNVPATTQTVQVGQTLSFSVSATDPDGDTVTLQAANLPNHSSFTPNPATGTPTATGVFSFTPAAGQANQTFSVQFTGTDTRGCSGAGASPITVQINVTSGPPPNSCPNISVPSATQIVPVGQVLTFNVSATDPDGDTVTLQASNLPANATFTPSPATGTPTATGTLRFAPSAAQGGQAFNILFTASDNRGCTGGAPVTVQITVPPGGTGNQCPVINVANVAPSVTVGQNLTFEVSATDPDGDTVTLQALNMPSGASFIPNPATGTPTVTGVFSFLPVAGQGGSTFNVQFVASDNRGCSGSGTVPVTVTITVFPGPGGANNCPVLTAPTTVQNFVVGRTTTFNVSATDPDGDTVTITATNLPAGATFTPNPAVGTPTATGVFSWTPTAAQGSLSFNVTFTATDTRGCSSSSAGSPNSRTVQINVAGSDEAGGQPGVCGNHAPIISIPTLPFAGLSETLTFLVRATDQDGDAVTVTADSLPDNASYDPATGQVSFSPSAQQLQQAQLGQGSVALFVAQDTKGAKSTALVDITPLATESDPKAPLLSIPAGPIMVKVVDKLSFGVAALSQISNCSTSITVEGLPTGATFNAATNLFSFTPTAAQMGQSFVLNFTATDCAGRKQEASLRIIVTDADGSCAPRGSGDADLSVKRIDFTNTKVGDVSGAATVSLTNRGGGPLMVSSFSFTDDTSYAIEGLGTLPATLQPGGVIEFRILFMPRAKGTFNSVLTIFTSDPDTPAMEIALKGKSTK